MRAAARGPTRADSASSRRVRSGPIASRTSSAAGPTSTSASARARATSRKTELSSQAEQILCAARDLAPPIRARAAEIEHARRIPLDLVAELRAAGFFRMLLPRSHGGAAVAGPPDPPALAQLPAAG